MSRRKRAEQASCESHICWEEEKGENRLAWASATCSQVARRGSRGGELLNRSKGTWRDGLAVKSTYYSCRGPGLRSQHAHRGQRASLTLVPWGLSSSPGLRGYQACMHIYKGTHQKKRSKEAQTHKLKRLTAYLGSAQYYDFLSRQTQLTPVVPVLVRVCIPEQNIMAKKQAVGRKRVYSAFTSTLLFITKGNEDRKSHRARIWRQKLMKKPWKVLLTGLLSLLSYRHPAQGWHHPQWTGPSPLGLN